MDYGTQLCYGIESMRRLVYSFYDHAFSFRKFLDAYPDMKGDMNDCLMGNLFRDFKPLFEAVANFAKVPEALSHGKPLESESNRGIPIPADPASRVL